MHILLAALLLVPPACPAAGLHFGKPLIEMDFAPDADVRPAIRKVLLPLDGNGAALVNGRFTAEAIAADGGRVRRARGELLQLSDRWSAFTPFRLNALELLRADDASPAAVARHPIFEGTSLARDRAGRPYLVLGTGVELRGPGRAWLELGSAGGPGQPFVTDFPLTDASEFAELLAPLTFTERCGRILGATT